jgi:hypothetical protein
LNSNNPYLATLTGVLTMQVKLISILKKGNPKDTTKKVILPKGWGVPKFNKKVKKKHFKIKAQ